MSDGPRLPALKVPGSRLVVTVALVAVAMLPTACVDDATDRNDRRQTTAEVSPPGAGSAIDKDAEPSTVVRLGLAPGQLANTSPRPVPTSPLPGPPITFGPPVPERGRVVINGVGDVSLDPGYIPALAVDGYNHALDGLDGLFNDDDLTVINLECPSSTLGRAQPKQFTFQCAVEALPIIKAQGVEVASQGNNHSLDYGAEALLDSIDNLRAAGIAPVGAGANAAEAHRPALFNRNGWTIAVIGFGGVVPNGTWIAGEDSPGMADGDTIATMTEAVAAADELADLVVVTIHWGVELQSKPPPDDVERAKAMIEAGADAIFGHHPHRLNALEFIDGVPVAWSLGNFVWPRLSPAGPDSAVAQVIVEADGSISACLLDVTIVSNGHPTLDDPTRRSC